MKYLDVSTTGLTAAILQPGNGTRYIIVTGVAGRDDPFVALPAFGKAAVMSITPHTWEYVAEKLDLGEVDAKVVKGYLDALALRSDSSAQDSPASVAG